MFPRSSIGTTKINPNIANAVENRLDMPFNPINAILLTNNTKKKQPKLTKVQTPTSHKFQTYRFSLTSTLDGIGE
jgi:hypothetical protein